MKFDFFGLLGVIQVIDEGFRSNFSLKKVEKIFAEIFFSLSIIFLSEKNYGVGDPLNLLSYVLTHYSKV